MIGIIILILLLLYIIYLNTIRVEKFAGMDACKQIGSGDIPKIKSCITGVTGEIDDMLDEVANISNTINGLIETKLNALIPISKITEIFSAFGNPKDKIYKPMCLFWLDLTGIETCKAAENVAKRREAEAEAAAK